MFLRWLPRRGNRKCCHSLLFISIIHHLYSGRASVHTHIHNPRRLRVTQTLQYSGPLSEAWLKHLCYKLLYRKDRVWENSYPPTPHCNSFWCLIHRGPGNGMQNAHCSGKVMDEIYFLVSYMPIWSCKSELVRLEPSTVGWTDSNEHINKKTWDLPPQPSCPKPPDESKSQRTLTSGPIYCCNTVPTNAAELGALNEYIWIKYENIYGLFPGLLYGKWKVISWRLYEWFVRQQQRKEKKLEVKQPVHLPALVNLTRRQDSSGPLVDL